MSSIIRLRDFCRGERQWLVDTIAALVGLESPSLDKSAVDRCGAEIARRIEAIGGRVSRLPQRQRGDHLRAEFVFESGAASAVGGGDAESSSAERSPAARVLLLGHFDTVWPVGQLQRMPIQQRDGRLYGPGVFDMKAGIALGLLAVRALQALRPSTAPPTGRRTARRATTVVMLWTSDEEVGSETSRATIEAEAARSDGVLVLEPSLPGGALKTSRKGCDSYEVTVRGVSAHAGIEPEKGASAIHELAQQILRIDALHDADRGVSVNVTQVSGGSAANVIPDAARAMVDVRATDAARAAFVAAALEGLAPIDPRTTIEVRGGFDRPPLERNRAVIGLFERARAAAAEMGLVVTEGSTGGGSDGNFTAALGVPTLDGLGAVGDGAHALHEHVIVDALPDRGALIAGLIQSI